MRTRRTARGREAQRKQSYLCFLKVIFVSATPYKRHPIGEDSVRQKNFCISHSSTELHFFSALHCDSALKSTAVFRINHLSIRTKPHRIQTYAPKYTRINPNRILIYFSSGFWYHFLALGQIRRVTDAAMRYRKRLSPQECCNSGNAATAASKAAEARIRQEKQGSGSRQRRRKPWTGR